MASELGRRLEDGVAGVPGVSLICFLGQGDFMREGCDGKPSYAPEMHRRRFSNRLWLSLHLFCSFKMQWPEVCRTRVLIVLRRDMMNAKPARNPCQAVTRREQMLLSGDE